MGRQRAQRAGGSGRARRDSPRVISIVIIATSCRICSGNSLGAFRVIVSEGFTHYIRVVTFEWPCSLLGAREASKAQPDQQRREFHATRRNPDRAYYTYRVSDITQAQQDRLPWGCVCGRGGKANGHVSVPRGKGPASAALTSEQQLSAQHVS